MTEMNNRDFLAHHGIKGQKWGIRRFQNKDGSLTPSGKKRYSDLANMTDVQMRKEINRRNLENRYYNTMARSGTRNKAFSLMGNVFKTAGSSLNLAGDVSDLYGPKVKNFGTAAKIGSKASNIGQETSNIWSKVGRIKKNDLSSISDEELDKLVRRAELERTYIDQVKNKKLNDAIDTTNTVLSTVGSVVGITAAGLGIYKLVKDLGA